MNERLRQTGRTTKLLFEAIKLWVNQEKVCVVFANFHDRERYEKKINLIISNMRCLFNNNLQNIQFVCSDDISWNWFNMTYRGLCPSTKYLIDHSAIEKRFGTILTELHRFDPK